VQRGSVDGADFRWAGCMEAEIFEMDDTRVLLVRLLLSLFDA
jgi:hypothetical protein